MINYTSEVVVARYAENIDWISTLNKPVTIYNKGNNLNIPFIKLENEGRESQTFLHHIVKNYNNLKDVTFFLQGNPFEHCKQIVNIINNYLPTNVVLPLCDFIFEESPFFGLEGRPGSFTILKDVRHHSGYSGLSLKNVANSIGITYEKNFSFAVGGQYAVPKSFILNKSYLWWSKALEIHQSFYYAPWFFERLWYSIFNHVEVI